jgi:23S rRNA (cytidine1920-2'-O)/16S rRNA (cytidine1409-2'-O)-methyltransferase
MSDRIRVDHLLIRRGLFESRAKAQAAIAAGCVTADGTTVAKPSDQVAADAVLVAKPAHPFVSRAGVKLAAALDHFGFNPGGRVCLDVGASTGGFTQTLIERGARRVYAVDVGTGQLHHGLRSRPEIVVLERTDIRRLRPAQLPEAPDFVCIDVSFISLKAVLPPALALVRYPARMLALIKPQFEVGRQALRKGIVRAPDAHDAVCRDVADVAQSLGWEISGIMPSPIAGRAGNREFFIGAARG